MAKITIAGNAAVLKSDLKKEDIQELKKYCPKALTVWGGEDNKEPMFSIGLTNGGEGKINKYGIEFPTAAADGCVPLTQVRKESPEEIVNAVADDWAIAVKYLNQLESDIPHVLESVRAERQQLMGSITVLQ